MFDHHAIAKELGRNKGVFEHLLKNTSPAAYQWRPSPDKWNLLEIVGHLHDEEREDFRARLRHVLETPDLPMLPIQPLVWVVERNYAGQDFEGMLAKFLEERELSIAWLASLDAPAWENTCQHPLLGPMSAKMILSNWLAHDYLHIRQINRYQYGFLRHLSQEDLSYAGDW
jgi:hypothetical protein